jgi:hypothetical protein
MIAWEYRFLIDIFKCHVTDWYDIFDSKVPPPMYFLEAIKTLLGEGLIEIRSKHGEVQIKITKEGVDYCERELALNALR